MYILRKCWSYCRGLNVSWSLKCCFKIKPECIAKQQFIMQFSRPNHAVMTILFYNKTIWLSSLWYTIWHSQCDQYNSSELAGLGSVRVMTSTTWPGLFWTIFLSQIYWWNLSIPRDPMYVAICPECWLRIVYCWHCWAPLGAVAWAGLSWYLWTVTFWYVQRLAQSGLSYLNVWIANCINKN